MKTKFFALATLFLVQFLSFSQASKKDFRALQKTFVGKYQAETTPTDPKAIASVEVVPLKLTFIQSPAFYVKWLQANGKFYRQRIYVFSFDKDKKQISSEAFSFKTDSLFFDFYKNSEKILALKQDDLKTSLGCPDIWQKVDNQFIGSVENCKFESARRGKPIYISGKLKVDADSWASTEVGKDENGKVLFGKIDEYALQIKRVKK